MVELSALVTAQKALSDSRRRGKPALRRKIDDDPYRSRLRARGEADASLSKAQGFLVLNFRDEYTDEARRLYDAIERFRHLLARPIRSPRTR